MLMQLSCGCCENPGGVIYADYFRTILSSNYAPAKDALETISGATVTQLLPTSLGDLADCEIYCLGCFGRQTGAFPLNGGIMTLNSTERGIIADWVNAGGKLLCCVEYRLLLDGGGFVITRQTEPSFYTELATLISDAGGSLTFGAEDLTTGSFPTAVPKDVFLADPWTTGNTGEVEYDRDHGSSITNGTQLFAPDARNTIVKQQCGSGWVICFGSQNCLWGNKDAGQSVPTGYVAMTQFLQFLYDL